jgi:hypothetical protein
MRLILITFLALSLLPASAAAQEPAVTTGPADPVGQTTATLNGTVDPNGTARTWFFEYGTTTAYGLKTADESTGAGDEPVAVQAALQNLTASTTYHFRLVAGGVAGADRTFKTTAAPSNPAPPAISALRATELTATSARLSAVVDPNRAATTWHVDWGTSTNFGNRTPDQTLPAGDAGVPVSIVLDGLPARRRIYWRVVASNAAGIKRSGRASFVTARAPSSVTLSVFPALTIWSRTVSISGRVLGAGVDGIVVALEQSAFPYGAGFHQVATARTNAGGEFRFAALPVFLATRFRAVPQIAPGLVSPELGTRVRSRVAIEAARRTRRSVRLRGHVNPGLPSGRATLQRRTRSGGWRAIARRALRPQDELRANYGFKVRRTRHARRYRVMVAAHDGGAHARGYSRSLWVAKRPAR